jgi:hypothetical protein
MKSYFASSIMALLGFAACGGSDLDPGAGNDPGQGTSTLTIDGNVSAQARLTNARTAGDYDTDLSVHVQLNGQPVTTGTVTVTSAGGTIALTYNPNSGNNDRWEGTAAGYDEVYILDVVSGPDKVTGVRVDGPDIHVFDKPIAGATVDSTVALPVAWTCDDTADSASIRAEQIDSVSIPDTGSYSLAAGALKAEKDQAHTNTVRLTRTNRVTPKGAAGGSVLSVSVQNEIEVVAQPNPLL